MQVIKDLQQARRTLALTCFVDLTRARDRPAPAARRILADPPAPPANLIADRAPEPSHAALNPTTSEVLEPQNK
jgi:hypothetical protein